MLLKVVIHKFIKFIFDLKEMVKKIKKAYENIQVKQTIKS